MLRILQLKKVPSFAPMFIRDTMVVLKDQVSWHLRVLMTHATQLPNSMVLTGKVVLWKFEKIGLLDLQVAALVVLVADLVVVPVVALGEDLVEEVDLQVVEEVLEVVVVMVVEAVLLEVEVGAEAEATEVHLLVLLLTKPVLLIHSLMALLLATTDLRLSMFAT